MNQLEGLWYEISPYVYFVVGLAALLFSHTAIGFAFSAILLTTAVAIFCLRALYRSPARERLRKYARPMP